MRCDVAVVGGGLVGATVADELVRAGVGVVVLDAGARPGHATRKAAGVAVPSLRYLTDPEFYDWLRVGQTRLAADIARLEPRYGRFSLARPVVRLLRPDDAATLAGPLAARGADAWVTAAELGALADGTRFPPSRQLLLDPAGMMVDGAGYLAAVQQAGVAGGVRWCQGSTVVSLAEQHSRVELVTTAGVVTADRVVIAAGAWSGTPALAPGLPVHPQRGQLLNLAEPEELPCILSATHYLAPLPGGGCVVGATEEAAGFRAHTTAAGISRLLRFALAVRPELAGSPLGRVRAGLRPVSDSGRPVVGRVPGREQIYLATGHAGHGLLSARLTAEGVAAGLVHDDWEQLPERFCPRHRDSVAAG